MSTRVYRLFQPGSPQTKVFLPNFWMKLVEVDRKVPPNLVRFEVSPQMTKYDVAEYLTKIYNLPVREVRMEVVFGKMIRMKGLDEEKNHFRFAAQFWQPLDKEEDKIYANVVLSKTVTFKFPNLFPIDVVEKAEQDQQKMISKQEDMQKEASKHVAGKLSHEQTEIQPGVPSWFS